MNFTHPQLRRIEEISQNASRPERGLMMDGWSIGLSPSKAKRSRSINAFYPSARSVETNLREAAALYRAAGLPCIFRMTPFVADPTLDGVLERMGATSFDRTCVQALSTEALFSRGATDISTSVDTLVEIESSPDKVGGLVRELRGDSDEEIAALVARWHSLPLTLTSYSAVDVETQTPHAHVATLREGDTVGIFDVVTAPAQRGKGLATQLLRRALSDAAAQGVHTAYLQVVESNPARRVYERLGFRTVYEYWYREVTDEMLAR